MWSHFNPVKIFADVSLFEVLPEYLPANGALLLVTTPGFTRRGLTKLLVDKIDSDRMLVCDNVTPNPDLTDLESLINEYRPLNIKTIIAVGGGSALDTAKVLSVAIPSSYKNPLTETLKDGKSQLWNESLPVICVPTTSGTGAEVTPFATVWDKKSGRKHSVYGESVFPRYALLDPSLTATLDEDNRLYPGLDCISHSLESLWNKNRTAASIANALFSLELALKSLPETMKNPGDLDARRNLQHASLLAGLAISQTKTAIAHSISYPLTLYYNIPHGLAASFTLKAILRSIKTDIFVSEGRIEEILQLLSKYDLPKRILQYLSFDDAEKCLPEMFLTERGNNFLDIPTTEMVRAILLNSF
ncbi:MAG: phosphonoacetaldehyde reductase [Candidatus Riflebacteria bacterium]|nr:phosphonoacetaldehyde reductase [Candidatus Riflebacteria bacterium]